MSRLVMIAVTGLLALFLTACGENGSKPAEMKTESTTVVTPDAPKTDEAGKTTDSNMTGSEQQKSGEENH